MQIRAALQALGDHRADARHHVRAPPLVRLARRLRLRGIVESSQSAASCNCQVFSRRTITSEAV